MLYDAHGKLMTVSRKTAAKLADPTIPFSLTCTDCDGGMDVHSFEHAASLGWRDIKHDDGPSWNYLGQCPDCIRAELTGDYSLFDGGSVKTIEVIQ